MHELSHNVLFRYLFHTKGVLKFVVCRFSELSFFNVKTQTKPIQHKRGDYPNNNRYLYRLSNHLLNNIGAT